MDIYLCPSPDLYQLYHRDEATVIITDIFRASTTITTALANGAKRVLPVATVEECRTLGEQNGYLMAAERNVLRCDFAQLGNDPLAYVPELVAGQTIVITTTNGTRSLSIANEGGAKEILIGSFRNLPQTISYLYSQGRGEVLVLAAGWRGQMAMEDCLYAGALAYELGKSNLGDARGDAAIMAQTLWEGNCLNVSDRENYLKKCEHYQRLVNAGFADAVAYCLEQTNAPAVKLAHNGFLYVATELDIETLKENQ